MLFPRELVPLQTSNRFDFNQSAPRLIAERDLTGLSSYAFPTSTSQIVDLLPRNRDQLFLSISRVMFNSVVELHDPKYPFWAASASVNLCSV